MCGGSRDNICRDERSKGDLTGEDCAEEVLKVYVTVTVFRGLFLST